MRGCLGFIGANVIALVGGLILAVLFTVLDRLPDIDAGTALVLVVVAFVVGRVDFKEYGA